MRGSARSSPTTTGTATGAEWIDRDGNVQFQPARAVVLCANGIGTPRLLLLSANDQHPDGLANSSGLVGRNLMLHPNCTRGRLLRGEPGKLARPGRSADPLHAVLRDRQIPRIRPRRQTARPAHPGPAEHHRGTPRTGLRRAVGPGHPRRRALVVQRHPVGGQHRGPARGPTTASHSRPTRSTPTGCPPRRSTTRSARTPARS